MARQGRMCLRRGARQSPGGWTRAAQRRWWRQGANAERLVRGRSVGRRRDPTGRAPTGRKSVIQSGGGQARRLSRYRPRGRRSVQPLGGHEGCGRCGCPEAGACHHNASSQAGRTGATPEALPGLCALNTGPGTEHGAVTSGPRHRSPRRARLQDQPCGCLGSKQRSVSVPPYHGSCPPSAIAAATTATPHRPSPPPVKARHDHRPRP